MERATLLLKKELRIQLTDEEGLMAVVKDVYCYNYEEFINIHVYVQGNFSENQKHNYRSEKDENAVSGS